MIKISRAQSALIAQLSALSIYLVLAIYVFDFPRREEQLLIILTFAVLTEQFFSRWLDQQWKLPLSALIAGSAIFMLIQSYSIWVYLFATFAAISSKYLFRYKGRHFFNPGNFGVVAAIIFSREDVALLPGQWAVDNKYILLAACLGLTACVLAKRWLVAVAYLSTFVLLGIARSQWDGSHWLFYTGSSLGMAGIIFQFHMITDPKTSPHSVSGQILFGTLIACLDTLLRAQAILFSPFLSLTIISGLYPLFYQPEERASTASMHASPPR